MELPRLKHSVYRGKRENRIKDDNNNPVCKTAKETQMYRTVFWTLCVWGGDDLGE